MVSRPSNGLAITRAERAFFASEGTAAARDSGCCCAGFIALLCAPRMWTFRVLLLLPFDVTQARAAANLVFDLNGPGP